jgi:glycosyltransferase involved in cell wall biosynthesis
MRVSVSVPTCNRCDKLRLLLDAMKTNDSAWTTETEVLVIDNNSSDATKQVVAEYTSLEIWYPLLIRKETREVSRFERGDTRS